MSMQQEEILKGFDRDIMKRLWTYTRKHRLVVMFALLALFTSTTAELCIPLIIQRTVDDLLLPRYQKLEAGQLPDTTASQAIETGYYNCNGTVFLSPAALARHPGSVLAPSASGQTTPAWIKVTRIDLDTTLAAWPELTDQLGPAFTDGTVVFLHSEYVQKLSPEQRIRLSTGNIQFLGTNTLVLLLLLLISVVFTFIQVYSTSYVGQHVMKAIRQDLLVHTMNQSQSFLQTNPVGKLVTRLTNDVETINELFTSVLSAFIKDIAIMIGVIAMMFVLDARLAGIALLTLLPVIVLIILFRSQARTAFRRVRQAISGLNTFLSEHLSGMTIIHLFVRQKKVSQQFQEKNGQAMAASLGEMRVFAIFRPLTDLLANIAVACVIWAGASQFLSGVLSLGILIAFINLVQRFFEPVIDISEKFNVLQSAMAGGERVFALLDEQHQVPDKGSISQAVSGSLSFRDVHFAYKPEAPVLRGLSFNAELGQKIAVVGYTGAGKTTIANILTRLWDIQSGEILLDGTSIYDYSLTALRQAIQPIQQDVFLFNDSIRENILMGKSMSDAELAEIIEQAQASEFIASLPEGLETRIAEGSSNISGGQKQLLSFARILAQNPRIIIMDEATASIDSETEQRIQKAIRIVMKGRTSLVIAHRLSTIQDADTILVLGSGKVMEQGNHSQLMENRGFYWNLFRLQFEHS